MTDKIVTPNDFAVLARETFSTREQNGYKNKLLDNVDKEICSSLIGTSYIVCAEIWSLLDPVIDTIAPNAEPKHLLWGLLLLQCYCTEFISARLVGGVHTQTFRKWSWAIVDAIAAIKREVIVFENRFRKWDGISRCLLSVDCIDTSIKESWPFDPEIYSQKLNGPGYKYEIGVSINMADIVWVNGPFKAGRSDITIFKEDGLKDAIYSDECVEADGGYQGDDKCKNPNVGQTKADRVQKGKVRGRHETVNGRLKKFRILDDVFRHSRERHQNAFTAVAVVVQLGFEFHGHLYDVKYNATYDE